MSTFVLDTNVAAAWYLPEAFSAAARVWQAQMLQGRAQLLVPSLHYWEFANVLRTYVRRAELDPALAAEIYDLHLGAPLEIAEPERRHVLGTALEYEATAYDAVFIALARRLNVPLITAERTTTPWVVKMGDRIESVKES
jgi:predicted nucleic acid-binding protein